MMPGEHEAVVAVVDADEAGTEQRPAAEIERLTRLLRGQLTHRRFAGRVVR